jgi:catechol 2,3-dioxygenase-like lactoylglutathione lyase family enzyme
MLRSAATLQVSDVVRSEAFYREKLGFAGGGFWGDPPCFTIVGRGAVTIFLDQSREAGAAIPVNQYWAAYVYVDDVDAYCGELRQKGVEILRGPEDMEHGCREFDVKDLDGHIIGFGQDLVPEPDGPGL